MNLLFITIELLLIKFHIALIIKETKPLTQKSLKYFKSCHKALPLVVAILYMWFDWLGIITTIAHAHLTGTT